MDWGTGAWSESESILPDFPVINDHSSQNYGSRSEIRLPGPSCVDTVRATTLDVVIKQEQQEVEAEVEQEQQIEFSELYTGTEDVKVFSTELIVNDDKLTETISNNPTQTQVLSYTTNYQHNGDTRDFLQGSTPSKHPKIKIVRRVSEGNLPKPTGVTQFSKRTRTPKDPLAISPSYPKEIIQSSIKSIAKEIISESIYKIPNAENGSKYKCTLCDLEFITPVHRDDHIIDAHERKLYSHTEDTNSRNGGFSTSLHLSPERREDQPVNTHRGQIPSETMFIPRKMSPSGLYLKYKDGETREERKRRLNTERTRLARERKRQNETPEQKIARLAADAKRQRKSLANETPEQRIVRLAADAERKRKSLANETPEQKAARLAADAERRRKYLANETPEKRATRLAADAERQRKYLASETPDQRALRLAADLERHKKYVGSHNEPEGLS